IALFAAAATFAAVAAQAKPEYARREKKNCAYCHTNPAGGGARNFRGMYYATHNHSFEGFGEDKPATQPSERPASVGGGGAKSGPPAFKAVWKMDLPKGSRRFAIADGAADKKPRLLVLGAGNALTVYGLKGEALDKESTVELGQDAASFIVGRFAAGKPAMIVVPGSLFMRVDDKYVKKPAPELKEI